MKKPLARFIKSFKVRSFIIKELFLFLWKNKMWWLIPMIILLLIFFLIMIFVQGSALGPFIYPLI